MARTGRDCRDGNRFVRTGAIVTVPEVVDGKSKLAWLKDTSEQVDNGRHPDFTLPPRIDIIVPQSLLGERDLFLRLIDTRGIDRSAARADLERRLDEPYTPALLLYSLRFLIRSPSSTHPESLALRHQLWANSPSRRLQYSWRRRTASCGLGAGLAQLAVGLMIVKPETVVSWHRRYVPMTSRLASALQGHRHLKSKRVLCLDDGAPLT